MAIDVDYRHAEIWGPLTVIRYPLSVFRYPLPVARIGQRATGTGDGRQKTGNGPFGRGTISDLNYCS